MSNVSNDCNDHEWEKSKENIKPLKGGRRLGEVLAALNKDNAHAKEKMEEFEMQLRILEDEELLDKWFDYVNWTEQYFISSNHEIIELMKRCVKHFISKVEFRDHEKLVKIWLKLSDLTIEANDIFMYMFNQEIGTTLAIYYKAWALHHEIVGNKKKADEIYVLGINRSAEPLEMLKQSHMEFEIRMTKVKAAEDENEGDAAQQSRAALNDLSSTKSGKVNSKRVKLQDITTSHSKGKSAVGRKCSSASVFEILADNQSKDNTLPEWSVFSGASKIEKKLPFTEGKENTLELNKMGHTKLKKRTPSLPVAPIRNFEIFRDDKPDTVILEETKSAIAMNSRKPLNSITSEVLEANTDMLQDLEQDINSKCVCIYPKSKVYMGVNEVSLEELKSQDPKYCTK